jgi:hypothetical protein
MPTEFQETGPIYTQTTPPWYSHSWYISSSDPAKIRTSLKPKLPGTRPTALAPPTDPGTSSSYSISAASETWVAGSPTTVTELAFS